MPDAAIQSFEMTLSLDRMAGKEKWLAHASHRLPGHRAEGLHRLDVRGLLALGALFHVKADFLAFLQRLEALGLDIGEVREEVVAAVVRRDESEALCIIEPLYCTCCNFS